MRKSIGRRVSSASVNEVLAEQSQKTREYHAKDTPTTRLTNVLDGFIEKNLENDPLNDYSSEIEAVVPARPKKGKAARDTNNENTEFA